MKSQQINTVQKILVVLVALVAAVASGLGVAAYFPDSWICDLLSQLRLLHALVLCACICALAALGARKAAAVFSLFFLINGLPIAALALPAQAAASDSSAQLKILNFNTEFQHNDRYDLFRDIVHKRNPDIIALVEIDQKWINAASPSKDEYPYQQVVMKGAGMALFSKLPIEKCDALFFGRSHHPRVFAKINFRGQPVNIVMAHPTTPKSKDGYEERNKEIAALSDEVKALSGPTILIGDLNCGPWAPAFKMLLNSGLKDSQQGFGAQPSWPARSGRVFAEVPVPPLVPIDHVLVSSDIAVTQRVAGPPINSDHLPVSVSLTVPAASAEKTPAAPEQTDKKSN